MIEPMPTDAPPALAIHAAQPQVEDTRPPLHCWTLPDGQPWCLVHRTPAGYRMRFPALADFLLSGDGLRVDCIPTADTDAPTVQHLFANQVLPAALGLQQRPVFHASALAMAGGAVAFLGNSGRGKSTLATFLARRGHALLSDDGLELREAGPGWLAIPNQPSVRLWEDSRDALLPAEAMPSEAVAYTRKQRFAAHGWLPVCATPMPLRMACFLGDGSASHPILEPLPPQQAHLAWVQHGFLLDVHDTPTLARQFRHVAALARAGISFRLDYPRRYDALPEVEALLRRRLAEAAAQLAPAPPP